MLQSTRSRILSALVVMLMGCAGADHSPDRLSHTLVATAPNDVPAYAENTPDTTRAAHRKAVAHLRLDEFTDACDTLDGLPPSERRSLTEYLTVLCMTRNPTLALSADEHGKRALHPSEAPALLDPERTSLVRHRAWIAAVQDDLAREAALSVVGFTPPLLPPDLIGSHNLDRLSAWRQRGTDTEHDAATYNRVRTAMLTKDLATRLAVSNLILRPSMEGPGDPLTLANVHGLLFADITGMRLPTLPAMSLPAEDQL